MILVAVVLGVVVLYSTMLKKGRTNRNRHSMVGMLGLAQLLTVIQMLSVIRRFNLAWTEPLASVLGFLEFLSLDVEVLSFNCLTTVGPVELFAARVLVVPAIMIAACLVHISHHAYLRVRGASRAHLVCKQLATTLRAVFFTFFIIFFATLLTPLQCREHPNKRWTVRGYPDVHCDGGDRHVQMLVLASVACTMPLFFIAVCIWLVMVQLPRRLARSDTAFLESCSFLIARFRPGAESSCVLFLIRGALVAFSPVLAAQYARILMCSWVLYVQIVMVALAQPWRYMVCNILDIALAIGLLVILDMGSFAVADADPRESSAVAMFFLCLMFLMIGGTSSRSMASYFFQRFQKKFKFFVCHQKSVSGSMAPLLQMALERQLPGTKTFIDCDDLHDLSRLFSYVGQDTALFAVEEHKT